MMTEPEDVGLFFCLNDLEPRMMEVSVDDVISAEHLQLPVSRQRSQRCVRIGQVLVLTTRLNIKY